MSNSNDDSDPPWKSKVKKSAKTFTLWGVKKAKIEDLSNPDEYFLQNIGPGTYLSVRRQRHIGRNEGNLPMEQWDYVIGIHFADNRNEEGQQLPLINVLNDLPRLMQEIYTTTTQSYQDARHPHGINLSVHFEGLDGSFTSSVRPIHQEDARDNSICELLEQLTNFTQSSKLDQNITKLTLQVTITELGPSGKGFAVLPISDPNFRRKRLCKQSTNGSILYVNSQDKCFFISIYLGIQHRRLCHTQFHQILSDEKDTYQGHVKKNKALADSFYDLLEMAGQELVDKAEKFFKDHKIDINNFDDGSIHFLKEVYDTFAYQVNIFDQSSQWELIQRWPEKYYVNLPQVNIIRIKTLLWSNKSRETKLDNFHYHGLSSLRKTIMGQLELAFCPFCGSHFHVAHKEHYCKEKKKELCYSCRRLKTTIENLNHMCPENRIHFCARLPGSVMIKCDKCPTRSNNDFCETLHKLTVCHHQRDICTKCTRKIKRVSKYSDLTKTEHDNCSEIWCQNCEEFYVDKDLHDCFIKRIKKAPKIPTGIAVFGKVFSPHFYSDAAAAAREYAEHGTAAATQQQQLDSMRSSFRLQQVSQQV